MFLNTSRTDPDSQVLAVVCRWHGAATVNSLATHHRFLRHR